MPGPGDRSQREITFAVEAGTEIRRGCNGVGYATVMVLLPVISFSGKIIQESGMNGDYNRPAAKYRCNKVQVLINAHGR